GAGRNGTGAENETTTETETPATNTTGGGEKAQSNLAPSCSLLSHRVPLDRLSNFHSKSQTARFGGVIPREKLPSQCQLHATLFLYSMEQGAGMSCLRWVSRTT
ncbi:unnamed protein product, partial [Ectocarpus sp. 4 AP-2014]